MIKEVVAWIYICAGVSVDAFVANLHVAFSFSKALEQFLVVVTHFFSVGFGWDSGRRTGVESIFRG